MAKVGDTIRIIKLMGDQELNGKIGEVLLIDDFGQLFGTWGSCGVIPLIDKFEIVKN